MSHHPYNYATQSLDDGIMFCCVVLCATIDLAIGFNPVNYSTNESSGFVNLTVQMLNGTVSGDEIIQVRVSTSDNTAESKPYKVIPYTL